jgi:hypothetical protein
MNTMRNPLVTVTVAFVMATVATTSIAQSATESLGRCVADSTTGKERKDLARWLFTAMAAHPEIKSMSKVTEVDLDQASRSAAATFTKLLADTCAKESKAAMAAGGPAALQVGFGVLGQMAMQELTSHPQVAAAMGSLDKYIDKARIDAALK